MPVREFVRRLTSFDLTILLIGVVMLLVGLFGITLFPITIYPLKETKPVEIEPNPLIAVIGIVIIILVILYKTAQIKMVREIR